LLIEQTGERSHVGRHVGMAATGDQTTNADRLAGERLAARPVARCVFQATEVVVHGRDVCVLVTEAAFENAEGTLVRLSGIREAAEVLVTDTEIVERPRHFDTVFSERPLSDPNRVTQGLRRIMELAAIGEQRPELHERARQRPVAAIVSQRSDRSAQLAFCNGRRDSSTKVWPW
jgi:hypothetical protein